MNLRTVNIRNFRSFVVEQGRLTPALELGDGLNLIVGPNNCGKSNLLRAVALALEDAGGTQFDSTQDIPNQLSWAYPLITLGFCCDPKSPVEKTLLRLVEEYERSACATKTFASEGDIQLRVVYRNNTRDVSFVVKGLPNKKGDPKKCAKALAQFQKSVRFIYLRSGESLNDFMAGTFKELLHTVLTENLAKEVAKAEKHRQDYLDQLKQELLNPLSQQCLRQLSDVSKEISDVSIEPFVPDLNETISRASIMVTDSACTVLGNKGTGVRGALLVALLGYIAKHSKRSLILAVEEPECFLHPDAQKHLRRELSKLAMRKAVTLLVTTHSPFMLDRTASTQITALGKDTDGRTQVRGRIRGNEPHSQVVGGLFGETITPNVLDSVQSLADGVRGVLFVEGYTDKLYLEMAAKFADRQDLFVGLEIRSDEGAHKAAVNAILLRQMVGSAFPIAALFDHDELGKSAAGLLREKFRWNGNVVLSYRKWRQLEPSQTPVEAEDMFPESLLKAFLEEYPPGVLAEKMAFKDGTFHYGFTQNGKQAFMDYLKKAFKASHASHWIKILEDLRRVLQLDLPAQAQLSSTSAPNKPRVKRAVDPRDRLRIPVLDAEPRLLGINGNGEKQEQEQASVPVELKIA